MVTKTFNLGAVRLLTLRTLVLEICVTFLLQYDRVIGKILLVK